MISLLSRMPQTVLNHPILFFVIGLCTSYASMFATLLAIRNMNKSRKSKQMLLVTSPLKQTPPPGNMP